jgi:hypothetical protein
MIVPPSTLGLMHLPRLIWILFSRDLEAGLLASAVGWRIFKR